MNSVPKELYRKQLDFKLKLKLYEKQYTQKNQSNILQSDYSSTLRGNNILSVSTKLNKVKAMLSNIRHDIDSITPKAIYYAIIESHLYCFSLVWAKSFIHLKKGPSQ